MTFNEKYPDAKPGEEPQPLLLLSEDGDYCEICGVETAWMETEFGVYFCSEECLDTMMEEFEDEVPQAIGASDDGESYALTEFGLSLTEHMESCEDCSRSVQCKILDKMVEEHCALPPQTT